MRQKLLVVVLLGALGFAGLWVLWPFWVSVAWAAILVHTTWPVFVRVRQVIGVSRPGLASAVMVGLLAVAFVVPLFLLIAALHHEVRANAHALVEWLQQTRFESFETVRALPWVGEWLFELINSARQDPAAFAARLADWAALRGAEITHLVGGAGRNTAKFAIALLTAYFFYRDGPALIDQLQRGAHRAIGSRIDHYIDAVGRTTRAVLFGLVLTALAQGALAGVGYVFAGLPSPVLLGALTALLALLPFGAVLVWGSASVALFLSGQEAAGVGLALWGALVVSWVDNLIRPMVISAATDIPFLLVMFGALGGLAAFGLVGVFVGPVLLAVLLAVWREWLIGAG